MKRLIFVLMLALMGALASRFSQAAEHGLETKPVVSEAEAKFSALTASTLKRLPRKEGAIVSENHLPPLALLEAAAELGKIEDLVNATPALQTAAFRFYRDCALEETALTATRALCLHNYQARTKAAGLYEKIKWEEFPENLRTLAEAL